MRIIIIFLLFGFILVLDISCDAIRRSIYTDKFEVINDLSSFDALAEYGLMQGEIDFPKIAGKDTLVFFKVIRNPYLDMNMSVVSDWEFRGDVDTPIAMNFTDPFDGYFYGNIYEKSFASFDLDELKDNTESSLGYTNAYSKPDTITTRSLFSSAPYLYYRLFALRTKDSTTITSFDYLLENESHMFRFSYQIDGAVDTSAVDMILSIMVNSATMNGRRILVEQ